MRTSRTFKPKDCARCGSPVELPRAARTMHCEGCLPVVETERAAHRREVRAAWKQSNPGYVKSRYDANPEHFRKAGREFRRLHPEKMLESNLKRFGLTLEGYNTLLATQNGVCAVCHCPETSTRHPNPRLSVDHDHETGIVRGLLCNNCNRSLGLLQDNIETLRSAVAYLEMKRL